ncbi:MAG: T9SS type A sorting domain-containing protein [Saprospiraceae bacterium]
MRHSYFKISHRQLGVHFQSIIQKYWACKSVRVLCFGLLLVAFGSLSHTRSFHAPYDFQGKVIGSRSTDSLALVGLAKVTNGDAWAIKWDFSQPLDTWFGVSLNPYGRVKCLDLDGEPDCTSAKKGGNKLKGMMPDLDLPYLEHLFLSGNQLTGQIPDFSKMPFLLTLQLSCNKFIDTIPDFSNFKRLVSLELDYNKLSGQVPAFTHLLNLENIYVSNNKLTGPLPLFRHSSILKRLYVQGNQLSGTLPLLNSLPKLQRFIAFDNHFEGSIPDVHMLIHLTHLNLAGNQLSGEIPPFDGLVQLRSIVLADNQLEGAIPELAGMTNLIEINLSNNHLSGGIPDFSGKTQLRSLLLAGNQLSDCPVLRDMPQLNQCALQENALDFSDLVPNQKWLQGLDTYKNQANQKKDSILVLPQGREIRISAIPYKELDSNTYTWYKNGTPFAEIKGENSLNVRLSWVEQQATYYCEITNDALPGLVYKTGVFILQSDKLEGPIALAPLAFDDDLTFSSLQETYEINLLANDQMNGTAEWAIHLLSRPDLGTVELLTQGRLAFHAPKDFVGTVAFEYELCNTEGDNLCNVAFVNIDIQAEVATQDSTPEADFDELLLYPNPAINEVNLSTKNGLSLEQVSVFNLAGQKVMEAPVLAGQISVGLLPAGNYFLEARSGQKTLVEQLVIVK